MKKIIAVIFLSWFAVSSTAMAGDINNVIDGLKGTPDKVSIFVDNEIEKTKVFQKANWTKVKVQWYNLISKFSSN